MSSGRIGGIGRHTLLSFRFGAFFVGVSLFAVTPANAVLTGAATLMSGQVRFEVVPMGVDDQTPKFSHTEDGKLNWETNSIGSGGFGGWPRLGAPAIVSDTGPLASLPGAAAGATPTFGGGTMAVTTIPTGPAVGLAWLGTVNDAGINGFASVATGLGSATWSNTGDHTESTPLDVSVVLSQIITVPAGGLAEIGFAGNTFHIAPGGGVSDHVHFYIVGGVDNSGSRTNISYGTSDPAIPLLPTYNIVQTAPTTYWVTGSYHFGEVIPDSWKLGFNGNLTLAADPGAFVRPGPIPTSFSPVAPGGLGIYGAEPPGSTTEWTNSTGTADFNIPANFSSGAPTAGSEAILADVGASTPTGKMISAFGPHSSHLITVLNSIGNYTIGTSPHQGSFSFGSNGGMEVYTGGPTVMNDDVSSSGQLNFRVGDPTTLLNVFGNVTSQLINVDGAGTVKLFSSLINFNALSANSGTVEFATTLTSNATIQIGNGGTVKLDGANSMINPPGSITIATGGQIWFVAGGNSVGATVNNSGTIRASGIPPTIFNGTLTNSGTLQVDAAATVDIGLPFSAVGTITNNGTIRFNSTYIGTHGIGGTGLTVFNAQLSTGAGSTADLVIDGNAVINNGLLMRLTGPTRGTQYDALDVLGNLTLGGTLNVQPISFSPALAQSFNLFDWTTLTGTFSSITLPSLAPDLMWNTTKLYVDGTLSVTIAGDYNGNGSVDTPDYVVWRKTGINGPAGYDTWRAHFGQSGGSGSSIANAAIPEPSSITLLVFTLLLIATHNRARTTASRRPALAERS